MWFEIIPSFSIVVGALTLPSIAAYGLNRFFLGNAFRRDTVDRFDRNFYQRDWRITGYAYSPNGLEAIPDE